MELLCSEKHLGGLLHSVFLRWYAGGGMPEDRARQRALHGRPRLLTSRGRVSWSCGFRKNRQFGPPCPCICQPPALPPARLEPSGFTVTSGMGRSAAEALFLTDVRTPLTRRQLSLASKDAFGADYPTHSLRLGLATEAAAAGMPDATINSRVGGAAPRTWDTSAVIVS